MKTRFCCLCLAPAIDATVSLASWPKKDGIVKNAADVLSPGGKGLNVARWLALRGAEVSCGGLLGVDNAILFEREMAKYDIADRFLRVPGATRTNEMFVTPKGSFKINRAAFPGLDPAKLMRRLSKFPKNAVVILSGSLPQGWPADTYRTLVAAARQCGARAVVLDASGAALVEGVKAHPDVIKPNAEECEALIGFVPKTAQDFHRATVALKKMCKFPIISDGSRGCAFCGQHQEAPKVKVLDTTAAGDTLLAEWCWRTFGPDEGKDAAQWAVAAGSAACTMPGGQPPDTDLVAKLFP